LGEENMELRDFRIYLSEVAGDLILNGMWLLGIEMPERM